ncbi:MAG: condensation domain-containing protein [Chitinophagaceae bacterium]
MDMTNVLHKNRLYDAGFVQRREWMLYKIREDRYPFNISIFVETDVFDPSLFQEVINLMLERHEILRTTFTVVNGKLKQVVHSSEEYEVNFSSFDMRELPESEQRIFHDEKVAAAMGTPFDFETGPLFRILVFEISANSFLLYFIFHHVISDQRSTEIFNTEIIETYKMLVWNPSYKLSEKYIQYREYAHFENELLDTIKGAKCRTYWETALSKGIPELSFVDKNRRDAYTAYYLKKVEEVKVRFYQLPFFDKRLIGGVIRRYQVEDAGEVLYIYDQCLFEKIQVYQARSKNGFLSLLIGSLLLAFNKINGQKEFAFEIPASRRVSGIYNQTMGWLTAGGPCYFDITDQSDPNKLLGYIDAQLYALSTCCAYPYETLSYNSIPMPGSHMPVFLSLSYLGKNNHSKESGIVFKRSEGSGTYQDIAFSFTCYANSLALKITYNNILFTTDLVEMVIKKQVESLDYMLTQTAII